MSIGDKANAQKDKLVGGAKEAVGDATDNEKLQGEGATQKLHGEGQEKVEQVKDGAKGALDDMKDKLD